ncbi:NINE protein [Baaleninema sp.]|uniref:NINE protein n=1 Tax=Baaleninema sp. TaxID=3101197 RepID=UPI003D03D323
MAQLKMASGRFFLGSLNYPKMSLESRIMALKEEQIVKNKNVAILLTFFLGWLGVHKFYLGQNFAGLLYLLFCWTGIPGRLAIFDFIGLLLMSDSAFNARYNHMVTVVQNNPVMTSSPGKTRSATEITRALSDLKKLYEVGALTAEEYEEKRQKLLKEL